MIPEWNESGVLPPYLVGYPSDQNAMAPYQSSMLELVMRFGTSPERVDILEGVISFREALRSKGIIQGFQWMNGSFVEDVEAHRGRAPADIDLVTFADRPTDAKDAPSWDNFIKANQALFHPGQIKLNYKCDAYYVDLEAHPQLLVNNSRYWFGVFSHQRDTFLWKGLLEIPLVSDDTDATRYLREVVDAT